jgi:hypothetical protein
MEEIWTNIEYNLNDQAPNECEARMSNTDVCKQKRTSERCLNMRVPHSG